MTVTITAFERSPDGGRGLARDSRVRWALEEVGQPYGVRPVSFGAMKEPAHLALHPFGQIPTYEEGDLVLFETGAIVLHIAERHPGLLPDDASGRARATAWIFAALNTVEPPILELSTASLLESNRPWSAQRRPLIEDRVRLRLGQLSRHLDKGDWLDGAFSAGDLMMVSVLIRLKTSGLLDEHANLAAYVARGGGAAGGLRTRNMAWVDAQIFPRSCGLKPSPTRSGSAKLFAPKEDYRKYMRTNAFRAKGSTQQQSPATSPRKTQAHGP